MNITESRYLRTVETMIAFLLILYPAAMLAVKGGMNGSFLVLLLLSMIVLAMRPLDLPDIAWSRDMTHYLLAMSALAVAIFLSQSYHHQYTGHPYDAASRFLLAVPVFMMLRCVRIKVLAMVQYGFPTAAIMGCLMSKHIEAGRLGIVTLDLIHFGDFELILAMLSVFSINWTGRDGLPLRILKILGFAAGVYASIASGSRGGWIALPLGLLIFSHFRYGKITLKALMYIIFTLGMTFLILQTFNQQIQQRTSGISRDIAALHNGNADTSLGVRLQLFKSAAVIFVHNPVFGAGPEGFAREMEPLLKAGKISAMAAEGGKGEVHNELLSKAAGLGIFGVLAMLSIYLVPARIFYRAMKSGSIQIRQSGMLGLVFVSSFMVFGLTVEVLNLTMAAAFYSLTVAVLLAACLNHGKQTLPNKL